MRNSPVYFTVGPTQVFPTYRKHILTALDTDIPSVSHRGDAFHVIFRNTRDALRDLLDIPRNYNIFFLSSATEAMERIIQNCVRKNSFHFVNGAFSKLFQTTSTLYGKQAHSLEVASGLGFTRDHIRVPAGAELVCITQNETSTGVCLDSSFVEEIRNRNRNVLIAVDVVSATPAVKLNLASTDCVFFSVQKGFGMPAGLAVLIVSPRAYEKALALEKKGLVVGSYHRFANLDSYAQKSEAPETPNVLAIYILGKIAEDLKRTGMKTIRTQSAEKAKILYSFFDSGSLFTVSVQDKKLRSPTTVVVEVAGGSERIVDRLTKEGFIVGKGYKDQKKTHMRIANFPAHTIADVKKLISTLRNFSS